MNGKILAITIGIIVAAAAIGTVGLCMNSTNKTSSIEIDGGSAPYIDDTEGITYTDYNTLVQIVQKLNTRGGQITDVQNRVISITTDYTVELCGDLIIAYTSGYTYVVMYDVHDIRSIYIS
jgi:hypothetical protein